MNDLTSIKQNTPISIRDVGYQIHVERGLIAQMPKLETVKHELKTKPESFKSDSFMERAGGNFGIGSGITLIGLGVVVGLLLSPFTYPGGILGGTIGLIVQKFTKNASEQDSENKSMMIGIMIGTLGTAGILMLGDKMIQAGKQKNEDYAAKKAAFEEETPSKLAAIREKNEEKLDVAISDIKKIIKSGDITLPDLKLIVNSYEELYSTDLYVSKEFAEKGLVDIRKDYEACVKNLDNEYNKATEWQTSNLEFFKFVKKLQLPSVNNLDSSIDTCNTSLENNKYLYEDEIEDDTISGKMYAFSSRENAEEIEENIVDLLVLIAETPEHLSSSDQGNLQKNIDVIAHSFNVSLDTTPPPTKEEVALAYQAIEGHFKAKTPDLPNT